jgi:hypothetical protein
MRLSFLEECVWRAFKNTQGRPTALVLTTLEFEAAPTATQTEKAVDPQTLTQ